MPKEDYSHLTLDRLEDAFDRKIEDIWSGIKYDSGDKGKLATQAAGLVRAMVDRACKETAAPLLEKIQTLEESQARLEYAFSLLQLRQSLESTNELNSREPTEVS
jgi:hypothetical protein